MLQTIILSLKKCEKLIIIMQNKIEITFEIYFLFLSIMFRKNIEKYNYFLSVDDEKSITRCEIIKIIYKINLDKSFKIIKIINKTLQHFVRVIFKQIRFFFDKCIKKNSIIAF